MNIFLDTNVFFNDPYLTKGKKPILLRLAKHKDVKLFINQTVYSEVLRKHKVFTDQELKTAVEALSKIKHLFDPKRENVKIDVKIEDIVDDVISHFETLELEEQLKIIPYDVDVLKDVVEMDMYEKEPFIKRLKLTNKKEEVVPYKKKEVRDSIIWYTYKRYIEKNNLENCFFISHNTKDFGAFGAGNTPKGQPYTLHENLSDSSNIIAYRDINDFLSNNAVEIKELFKDKQLHERILSDDFAEQIEEELKGGLATVLVEKHLIEQITQYTESYLSDTLPEEIHDDYYMGGYVEPTYFSDIDNVELIEVMTYGGDISVAVSLEIDVDIDINLYNPAHNDRIDKHQYYATDRVKIEESVIFLLPIDEKKALDVAKFSLRDYVKGIEPRSVDIQIVSRETIEHEDMFNEEDFDEPHR
ncbi:PIN domain-containing protein [Fictibacillus fluitans]|uniref:PIN domain-containing protein n=1 Tax=Fictibacillus fluitans TaxID=3058422 RepID=A0ABT8HUG0_9BACL|nr:PIN domain-containing protein [Fictibacillus sp. NE201]MDN4524401.1 PIN domain-containing protein [Fictibacillus sp. NE201]